MEGPLNITEGPDGILRDTQGRSMVLVYDSNEGRVRARGMREEKKRVREENSSKVSPLLFVNVPEPKQKDKATRRLIRTQVMRNFKRQQMESRSKPTLQIGQKYQQPYRVTIVERYNSFWPSPLSRQPTGSLDPFTSYPVPMRPHTYRLVHHYLSILVHNMYPREPDNQLDLFQLAMTNPALFHTILSSSSIYIDIHSGRPESCESVLHKLEAIHCLSECLNGDSEISDASIATVAYLAKIEFTLGNDEMWSIHRKGMIQMVEMRGGIKTLSKSLQGKVIMADLVGCIETDCSPFFPLVKFSHLDMSSKQSNFKLPHGFQNLASQFSLDADLLEILLDVQFLTDVIIRAGPRFLSSDQLQIDHLATNLRHRLLSIPSPTEVDNQRQLICETCRLGALLYIKNVLPSYQSRRKAHQVVLRKLKTCIEKIHPTTNSVAEFILYQLFLFDVAKYDKTDQSWLVERLSSVAVALHLKSWDRVTLVLEKFWRTDIICTERISGFWNASCEIFGSP